MIIIRRYMKFPLITNHHTILIHVNLFNSHQYIISTLPLRTTTSLFAQDIDEDQNLSKWTFFKNPQQQVGRIRLPISIDELLTPLDFPEKSFSLLKWTAQKLLGSIGVCGSYWPIYTSSQESEFIELDRN